MKKLGFAVLVSLLGASAYAQVTQPKTLKMKVGIGLGYQLCPPSKGLPSLADAFLCSGLSGAPQTVEVELTNMPAAKPEWLFYQGNYNKQTTFHDITITLEALVMYAKVDGNTISFVDGRVISTRNGVATAPVYFRASAQGGFDKMAYSSSYGAVTPFVVGKNTDEFSPYVTIDAPR